MENVPLLATHTRFLRTVRRLRKLGYGVRYDIVDAASFGVPQRRKRLALIAIKGLADAEVPALTVEHPSLAEFAQRQTVRQAFATPVDSSVPDDLNAPRLVYPEIVARRIAAIPPDGGSRSALPIELQLACHKRLVQRGSGNVYGRMRWDDVAPTLTTRCTTPACGRYLHPEENRAITLREASILQSFPPAYIFKGGTMAIQAQIGNAVPPRLAQAIATLVLQACRLLEETRSGSRLALPAVLG
jgi:DNA (cytosine-5)-methyltransferase 1